MDSGKRWLKTGPTLISDTMIAFLPQKELHEDSSRRNITEHKLTTRPPNGCSRELPNSCSRELQLQFIDENQTLHMHCGDNWRIY